MPNNHSTLTSLFGDIADAIRAKTGSSASIVADAFPAAISAIPTGITPSGTLSISSNGIYDVTNYASASVSVAGGEYYSVYKMIADRGVINAASYNMSDWCSTLSQINLAQFEGARLTGTFNFPNVAKILSEGFRSGQYGDGYARTVNYSFPVCTEVGGYAFYDRYYIGNLYLPECTYIGAYAFAETIFSGTTNFNKVVSMSNSAFQGAKIATISMPSCTSIPINAFAGVTNLTTAYFPCCTTVSTGAFVNCSNLSALTMGSVEVVGAGAFSSCTKLSSFTFDKCTTIGANAFDACAISGVLSASLCTQIGAYGFYKDKITSAYLPACTSLGNNCFASCTSLSSVSLPNLTATASTAFAKTIISSLALLKLSVAPAYAFKDMNSLNTAAFSSLTAISGSSVFQNCFNLLSLYLLGSSLVTLGNKNAFTSTPISTYTTSTGGVYGSIYVPSSLYASYIAATNWVSYSARFVSLTAAQISALPF